MNRVGLSVFATVVVVLLTASARGAVEPPSLAEDVAAGLLPPVNERLPETPSVVVFDQPYQTLGRYGGTLKMLMGRAKDTRMMVVYGYARLVGYTPDWVIVPDILERIDVKDGRIFTFTLRKGHKWSDGHPFTSEDFRFYWEDVASQPDLSLGGVPHVFRIEGKAPVFEVINETTVRYSWDKPNPYFLPLLAGARPEFIYIPAHYMKQFHAKYADPETLKKRVEEEGQRNWVALFYKFGNQYRNDNPEMPSLQPWVLVTEPPSTRFVFERNPYYYRVDSEGRQLPYIDEVAFSVVNSKLIPAKAAAGDAHLQARGLSFENYAILKQGEDRNEYDVVLWHSARGSEVALLPNLNVNDPEWNKLFREADFRRALSLAINRDEINQVVYFGLGRPGNDTVLPKSPLFRQEYETAWADFDIEKANEMLDSLGLEKRDGDGIRLLPSGKRMEIVVETAGEDSIQVDVLQLIRDTWDDIGIKMHIKPQQREVMRNRVFAGASMMSVWSGLENALPVPQTAPHELAPTNQHQLYWPKWGQYVETGGNAGEAIDLKPAEELAHLSRAWESSSDPAAKTSIWHRMLQIRADNAFTLGTVRAVPQPVVISKFLRNVPRDAVYNWEPGAHFGIYRPDTFWFEVDDVAKAD